MNYAKPIRTITVVGTGLIGSGWTAHYLARGFDVVASDPAPNAEGVVRKFVDDAWGLLSKVVPDAELMPEALALARRIAALPPGPVRDLRRILAHRSAGGLEAAMAAETEATIRGFLDPETAKRVAAFK